MCLRTVLATLLLASLSHTILAQDAAPKVSSGDVELKHSHVYIRVDKTRVGHVHAVVGQLKSGQLRLRAADDPTIEPGTLIFDMTTFDADTKQARDYLGMEEAIDDSTRKQVNENMLGKAVLDVRGHPTATFVAKKIVKVEEKSDRGLQQFQISGDFTLHGMTKPIEFKVDVEEVKGWLHIRGAFAILQTQFGIKPYTKAFGVIGVADKLDIYGDLIVAP